MSTTTPSAAISGIVVDVVVEVEVVEVVVVLVEVVLEGKLVTVAPAQAATVSARAARRPLVLLKPT